MSYMIQVTEALHPFVRVHIAYTQHSAHNNALYTRVFIIIIIIIDGLHVLRDLLALALVPMLTHLPLPVLLASRRALDTEWAHACTRLEGHVEKL